MTTPRSPRATRPGDEVAPRPAEFRSLTGLRIVAAAWVVLFHFHFTGLDGVGAAVDVLGQEADGELTIGENIGDLGGLTIAHRAWRLAVGPADPEPIDGLTGSQRLFMAWALAWRHKSRTEALITQLTTDPHSPDEFRCNQVVRNIPEFYDTFGVTGEDELWLAPEQRVKIW